MRTHLRSPNLAPGEQGIMVRLIHPKPLKLARGGLATHANLVRSAGRYGDDTLVHMSRDEFQMLRKAWGEPTINPQTGMPEYFWAALGVLAAKYLPAIISALGSSSSSGGSGGSSGSPTVGPPQITGAGVVPVGTDQPKHDDAQALLSKIPPSLLAKLMSVVAPTQTGMARGGLAQHAHAVRAAGTDGDNMLVHMNQDELNLLRHQWGEPDVNPRTGLPEYSWFSKLLSAAAPIVGTVFGGPLGGLVGGLVSSAIAGRGGSSTPAAATPAAPVDQSFSNHLQPATFNRTVNPVQPTDYYTYGQNGGEHPFFLQNSLNDIAADAPTTPTATPPTMGPVMGRRFPFGRPLRRAVGGLAQAGMSNPNHDLIGNAPPQRYGPMGRPPMGGSAPMSGPSRGVFGGILSQLHDRMNPRPIGGLGSMSPAPMGGRTMPSPSPGVFGGILSQLHAQMKSRPAGDLGSMMPQRPMMSVQAPPMQQAMADGGSVSGPGTGRSDDIDAKLSDGEYVFDAQSVALLGDGSTKAGAAKLDAMRRNLRKHKGSALAKGNFGPAAKQPERYMGGA